MYYSNIFSDVFCFNRYRNTMLYMSNEVCSTCIYQYKFSCINICVTPSAIASNFVKFEIYNPSASPYSIPNPPDSFMIMFECISPYITTLIGSMFDVLMQCRYGGRNCVILSLLSVQIIQA